MSNSTGINWYKGLNDDPEYLAEDAKIEFAAQLEQHMEAQRITRIEFARRMKCSAAYVTKLLRGDANCTIETMVHAAHALKARLHLKIADKQEPVCWYQKAPVHRGEAIFFANVRSWVDVEFPQGQEGVNNGGTTVAS